MLYQKHFGVRMLWIWFQAEVEASNAAFEDADAKSAVTYKQVTSLEAQLADAQELLQEETKQKLALQTKLRQLEEQCDVLQEQMEDSEEAKKTYETKLAHALNQVSV